MSDCCCCSCAGNLAPEEVKRLKTLCRDHRKFIIEATNRVKCGHTGGSLSEVEIMVALYFKVMNIDPAKPDWAERDRFILSKGHATPGYYTVLAMRGYYPKETLELYDQIDSPLQGHPCMNKTPGVDMSTGSLGQGLSVGIGMTLGRDLKNQKFNVFVLMGDGEQQEGQIWEAAMFAGSRKCKGLIGIVDFNKVQLAESVDNTLNIEPLAAKWRAFGWQVLECDGHDVAQVVLTMEAAKKLSWEQGPVAILAHTVKGKGVSFMENKYQWHGKACNDEEAAKALAEIEAVAI